MSDPEYNRWAELRDREAVGDALTPVEAEACAAAERDIALCAEEAAVWQAFAEQGPRDEAGDRAVVEAVLAAIDDPTEIGEQETTPRRRPIAWMGAAAAVLLVAGVAWLLTRSTGPSPTPTRAEVVLAAGDVRIGDAPAVGRVLLGAGDSLVVDRGRSCVAIDPGIDVCLSDNSKIEVVDLSPGNVAVKLHRGTAAARLDPQPEGSRFVIAAGDVEVIAVGTVFTVEAGDHHVMTTVIEGEVRVAGRSVSANQRARVDDKVVVEPVARADVAAHRNLVEPTALWQATRVATLHVSSDPEGAMVSLDGETVGITPLVVAIGAGEHTLAGEDAVTQTFVAESGEDVRLSLRPAAPPEVEPAPPPPAEDGEEDDDDTGGQRPSTKSAATLLAEARALRQQRRWRGAAKKYRRILSAHRGTAEAQTVLVPLAQLELDRLGQARRALQHFERYLKRGGPGLKPEARYGRIRALRRLGRRDQEAAAIREFLRLHPKNVSAVELRARAKELR